MAKEALTAVREAEQGASKALADAGVRAEEIRSAARKTAGENTAARLERAREECDALRAEAAEQRADAEGQEREKTAALIREIGEKHRVNGEAAVQAVLKAVIA